MSNSATFVLAAVHTFKVCRSIFELNSVSEMPAKRKTVKTVKDIVEILKKKIKHLEEKVKTMEKLEEKSKYLEESCKIGASYYSEITNSHNDTRLQEKLK